MEGVPFFCLSKRKEPKKTTLRRGRFRFLPLLRTSPIESTKRKPCLRRQWWMKQARFFRSGRKTQANERAQRFSGTARCTAGPPFDSFRGNGGRENGLPHQTPPSPAQAPATPPLSGEARRTGLAMTRGTGEPLPSAAGVTRRCHLPRRGRQARDRVHLASPFGGSPQCEHWGIGGIPIRRQSRHHHFFISEATSFLHFPAADRRPYRSPLRKARKGSPPSLERLV